MANDTNPQQRPQEPDESFAQTSLGSRAWFLPRFLLRFYHRWFLATVAFGLLSKGHFIFVNIMALIAQTRASLPLAYTLMEENWTELDDDLTLTRKWLFTIVLFLKLL